LDSTKLAGIVPIASIPNGNTNYIQASNTLQSGATFYVSSGTVAGTLYAGTFSGAHSGSGASLTSLTPGNISAGSLPGTVIASSIAVSAVQDASIVGMSSSKLIGVVGVASIPNGNTNYIQVSNTLQANSTFYVSSGSVNGLLTAGSVAVTGSSVTFAGAVGADAYVAVPLTAAGAINAKRVVIITAANTVNTTTIASTSTVAGITVSSTAGAGTIYVAVSGVVTAVPNLTAVAVGDRLCTSTTAGSVIPCGVTTDSTAVGKSLSTAGAGSTVTVLLGP
jgi:hypothetical protein